MPQYRVTYKGGATRVVIADSADEARRLARDEARKILEKKFGRGGARHFRADPEKVELRHGGREGGSPGPNPIRRED